MNPAEAKLIEALDHHDACKALLARAEESLVAAMDARNAERDADEQIRNLLASIERRPNHEVEAIRAALRSSPARALDVLLRAGVIRTVAGVGHTRAPRPALRPIEQSTDASPAERGESTLSMYGQSDSP